MAKEKENNVRCGTKDLRACWQLTVTCARPSDARIVTAASIFICVLFCCTPRPEISRTRPDPRWIRRRRDHDHAATSALADLRARNSDAKSAIVAPRSIGLPLSYSLSLHISYTRAEPHGIRGRTKNNPAALCSRAFMWQCTHARLRRPDRSCLRTLPS